MIYEKGINKCIKDIEEKGIEYARKKLDLMKKDSCVNQEFINGYEWHFITVKNNLD